jgi:hypothetical protein
MAQTITEDIVEEQDLGTAEDLLEALEPEQEKWRSPNL